MDYKRYDVVVIPPPEIAQQTVALSRALAPLGTFFTVDDVAIHPHISLYHIPLAESSLQTVSGLLQETLSTIDLFPLEQETYYPDQGVWVGVRYVASKPILDLHTLVIDALKGCRVLEDDTRYAERWPEMNPEERKNLKECGWAHAYTHYSPHITFTKLKTPQVDVLAHLPQYEFSFIVDHVGLYELGEHGTATRLVADFWLTGQ
jgi:2'-5' RNA ligase